MTESTQTHVPLLRCEGLGKTYPDGQVHALRNVDLKIGAGEYVALTGSSGSGKSTLLNLLGALDQPTSGQLLFRERPYQSLGNLDTFRARHLGFVFQSFHLLPVLNALENVQIPMFESSLPAGERDEKAKRLLTSVGMQHRANHLPNSMSVGERQRVAVARALANDPLILLADEPTGNLDSKNAVAMLDLFDSLHRQRNVTILMVTHDMAVAGRAQRVLVMHDGRIVSDERTAQNENEPRQSGVRASTDS
jgi:putative ABC transport system ATP-binding protein